MILFGSLISGSSGNATILSDGKTTILTDCGISAKALGKTLTCVDIPIEAIDAILITHEHTDHTKGLGVLARKLGMPIYASRGTIASLPDTKFSDELLHPISDGCDFEIGSIGICPFSIPHDASEPLGYTYFCKGKKLALATDIGETNDKILSAVSGSDTVLLESNHDIQMLRYGSYPDYLKRRILGSKGHLSNEKAAEAAVKIAKTGTKNIILGHLSRENNMPDIAYITTAKALSAEGIEDINLRVADRYAPTVIR